MEEKGLESYTHTSNVLFLLGDEFLAFDMLSSTPTIPTHTKMDLVGKHYIPDLDFALF